MYLSLDTGGLFGVQAVEVRPQRQDPVLRVTSATAPSSSGGQGKPLHSPGKDWVYLYDPPFLSVLRKLALGGESALEGPLHF